MSPHRWFLPESPDVLGMLCEQAAITVDGLAALVSWSEGSADAADDLRACEHRADAKKRELREALTSAFSTPLEPEDIFQLSRGLDDVLNGAKNTVREAEVMHIGPDTPIAAMARSLSDGARCLGDALDALARHDQGAATGAADGAVKLQRRLEHEYRTAMSSLIDQADARELAARRELYRRLARMSDRVVEVAERVWYSVLKQG